MRNQDERRRRVFRSGALQVLWALLLVYLILIGAALLFGRSVGYELAFGVCLGLAGLVTVSFAAIYLLDRLTAEGADWLEGYRQQKKKNDLLTKGQNGHEENH